MDVPELFQVFGPATNLQIVNFGGFQSRNEMSLRLIQQTFARYCQDLKDFDYNFYVYTGDNPECVPSQVPPDAPILAYTTTRNCPPSILAMPDFLFMGWPEIGFDDYDALIKTLRQAGTRQPKYNKVFWNGSPQQHLDRKHLLQMGQQHPDDMAIVPLQWVPDLADPTGTKLKRDPDISLSDHADYSMLLDVRGTGYSARLKLLMHIGRPVFLVTHGFDEFFFSKMRPFEEFIPLDPSLEEFPQMVRELKNNPAFAQHLGHKAKDFAAKYLTQDYALSYMFELLFKIGKSPG